MTETEDYAAPGALIPHKTTHQDGGSDEVSVLGLSGLLANSQNPLAHKTSHQDGGSDEISVQALSGLLGDPQNPLAHKTSHQDGGTDEISVGGLSGLLADDQHVLDTEVIAAAQTIKLDDFAAPDDNTDLNVSITLHGLCPKAPNDTTKFLRGDASWAVAAGGDIGEGHLTFMPWAYNGVIQGTWVLTVSTSYFLYGYFSNSTAANGDQISFMAYLSAGTYTFAIIISKSTTSPILDLLIDGVSKGTLDLYNSPTIYNQMLKISSISITTSGLKTISLKANDKNPLSTSYVIRFGGFSLYRSA